MATPTTDKRRRTRAGVVVLPFTNLSPNPDDGYISDGLTDEIISALGRIRTLRVISRHSAMRLRDTDLDLPTIADRLNVDDVMEGSVRKHESSLRITAHLVDPRADGERGLYNHRYLGELDPVLADLRSHEGFQRIMEDARRRQTALA